VSIKALIFDLHGVLLISEDEEIETTLAKHLNIPEKQVGGIFHGGINDRADIGEFTEREYWLLALDEMGLSRSRLPEVEHFYEENFFIDPVMLETIHNYRRYFKTALLSNYADTLRPALESIWDIGSAFDEIIISWEIKMIKPQPEIFDYTLKKLHVSKDEAVLVDDRILNIRGALEYGMHAVHFKNRDQAISEIEKLISTNNSGLMRQENLIVE